MESPMAEYARRIEEHIISLFVYSHSGSQTVEGIIEALLTEEDINFKKETFGFCCFLEGYVPNNDQSDPINLYNTKLTISYSHGRVCMYFQNNVTELIFDDPEFIDKFGLFLRRRFEKTGK